MCECSHPSLLASVIILTRIIPGKLLFLKSANHELLSDSVTRKEHPCPCPVLYASQHQAPSAVQASLGIHAQHKGQVHSFMGFVVFGEQ